jgi:LPXTG-motif cell wall-anchored protein
MYGRASAGAGIAAGGLLATGQNVVAFLIAGTAAAVLAGIAVYRLKTRRERRQPGS